MSTLLISRLRLAGIPAYPVLVLTRDQGKIDPAFPEFGFNHLIAAAIVEGDTLWMDPTCATCPFGDIPRSDEDIPVLLITDESGTIVSTPASRPDDNLVVSRSAVEIQADGHAKIVTEISSRGNQAQTLRYMLPHVERGEEKRFYDMLLGNSVGTDLVSYRYEHLMEIDSPLVIYLTTNTTRPLQEIEGCQYVGLPLIQDPYRRMMRDFDNSRPAVDLSFPRRLIDSVTIVVADGGQRSYAVPDSAFATSPFATAYISGSDGGDGATIVFERANNGYRVTSDQFEALTEFCAEISKLARTAIAVCGM